MVENSFQVLGFASNIMSTNLPLPFEVDHSNDSSTHCMKHLRTNPKSAQLDVIQDVQKAVVDTNPCPSSIVSNNGGSAFHLPRVVLRLMLPYLHMLILSV